MYLFYNYCENFNAYLYKCPYSSKSFENILYFINLVYVVAYKMANEHVLCFYRRLGLECDK